MVLNNSFYSLIPCFFSSRNQFQMPTFLFLNKTMIINLPVAQRTECNARIKSCYLEPLLIKIDPVFLLFFIFFFLKKKKFERILKTISLEKKGKRDCKSLGGESPLSIWKQIQNYVRSFKLEIGIIGFLLF